MAPAFKDAISITALTGALCAFFVFASQRWIGSVEAQFESLKAVETKHGERIVTIETSVSNQTSRLDRIEYKIDRLLARENPHR